MTNYLLGNGAAKMAAAALLSSSLLVGCVHTDEKMSKTVSPEVSILAFGDSGYFTDKPIGSGLMPTANAMSEYCQSSNCDFALMAGDNIYPSGMSGLPGSNFDKEIVHNAFIKPFGELGGGDDDFKIYVTLGNHDWETSRIGAEAQVDFMETTDPFYMDGIFYSVRPPSGKGEIEVFVVDTTMLLAPIIIEEYEIGEDGVPYGSGEFESAGKETAVPVTEAEKNQLKWFEEAISQSDAKWKIVLAHHPLWESTGSKADQAELLRKSLRPIVCEYADVYVAGHQHTLEVHEDACGGEKPMLHVVSGAAGKTRTLHPNFIDWQSRMNPDLYNQWHLGDSWGFGVFDISGDELNVSMYATKAGTPSEPMTKRFSTVFKNR